MKSKDDKTEVSFENIIAVPPDGGWGWVVVVAAFYCIFVMDGIANTYGLLLPIFQSEFDASLSQVSLINSLFTGFYFLFGPVASSLSNRFGFRAVIISGSIVSAFGIGISVLNTSVQLMFLTYGFVGGLGFSLMYINVVLTVGFYFERWRALATGITVSASGVGTFSFAPAVQLLLKSYTWRHILVGYAGLVFLCSAVAMCFRPLASVRLNIEVDGPAQSGTHQPSRRVVSHNKSYPTAAEATNITSLLGSKVSLLTANVHSSLESVEVKRHLAKEHQSTEDQHWKRSTLPRAVNVDEASSFVDSEQSRAQHHIRSFSSIESLEVRRESARSYHPTMSLHSRRRPIISRTIVVQDASSITESNESRNSTCSKCCCSSKKCTKTCLWWKKPRGLRPLYRDDIFYEGSVTRLPIFEKNLQSNVGSIVTTTTMMGRLSRISNRTLFYNMSVSRLPTRTDVRQEEDRKFRFFPERFIRVLKTMFDFGIIKIPVFMLFVVSTSLLAIGALVPIQFSYVRAVELKIMNKDEASLMLSAVGITNTVGRIICGFLGSIRRVNIILLHVMFLLLGAFLNVGVIFFFDKTALYIYATLYGFVLAEQGCLRSVILVKLVGLENLTNAFGILLLFLGFFTIVGSPLAAYLKDVANSYDSVFYFSSALLALSAVAVAPILFWKKCIDKTDRNSSSLLHVEPVTSA